MAFRVGMIAAPPRFRFRLAILKAGVGSLSLLMVAALVTAPTTAAASSTTRTPADPVYSIALTGTADARTWTGSESISFRNASTLTLPTIWLRLWSNGIAGCGKQAIVVSNITGGSGGTLTRSCSALPITLAKPLAPGATATIGMQVAIHVPLHQDRFGYYEGVAMLGSALPTLAIHDAAGWHLDPYADLGESYYSVSGTYNVNLIVPSGLKIASTGQVVSDHDNGNGTRTRTIAAANVRDFEWAAGAFRELSATDDRGTDVNVWYVPGYVSKTDAEQSLQTAVDSMNKFSASFGTYPYPEVDVVLSWIGYGMEYPQIVFTIPGAGYVSHEIAHQWWYGIVGDDQYASPWLDESFATWSASLPYGKPSCAGVQPWPSASTRITRPMSYWTRHSHDYWVIYTQGACALVDAADHLGFANFVGVLHDYAKAHWYGITTTSDFKAAIDKAAAKYAPGWNVAAYWTKWRIEGS